MRATHRSPECSSAPACQTSSPDEVPAQIADASKDARTQKRKFEVIDCRLDYEQVQERWHRDPWGRQDTQSVTKAVENQRNLEEALYNEGFSQVRASKIAYYMTRCEGQFQAWDFIVKKQPRLKNRVPQLDKVVESTSSTMQDLFDDGLDEDAEEEDIGEEESDREGSETTSMTEGGRKILQDSKAAANVKVSPAKSARQPRSQKDERRRRRDRKDEALRLKEYANYTYEDYVQAARRFDIVYGSADRLYELAKEKKASLRYQVQRMNHQSTTEMMIQDTSVDVEDPTFGITRPSADQILTPEERKTRDHQDKQLRVEKQKETLTGGLEKLEIMQGKGMFN